MAVTERKSFATIREARSPQANRLRQVAQSEGTENRREKERGYLCRVAKRDDKSPVRANSGLIQIARWNQLEMTLLHNLHRVIFNG